MNRASMGTGSAGFAHANAQPCQERKRGHGNGRDGETSCGGRVRAVGLCGAAGGGAEGRARRDPGDLRGQRSYPAGRRRFCGRRLPGNRPGAVRPYPARDHARLRENEVQEGIALKGQSSTENALADIAAARDFVKEAGKAAVIGYCWGGFLAWVSATRLPGLAAAVSYYGGGIGTVAQEQPRCPVLMHFGEKDHAIPLTDVEKVRAAH